VAKAPGTLEELKDRFGPGPAGHWQALCPACKRKSLSTAQLRIKETARG
jgi:hypothetical protein